MNSVEHSTSQARFNLFSARFTEELDECRLVTDGEAAKEEVERDPPSLAITDIEMPMCNGLELLSTIRSHPQTQVRRIAVIVISSLRDEKMIDVVKNFGGTSVMSKPLERLRVRDILNAIESGIAWVESYLLGLHMESQLPAVSPKLRRELHIEKPFKINQVPSDTQMREILDGIEIEPLNEAFADLFWEIQRGGELKRWLFDGQYYLVAIDGSGYFYSDHVRCDHCLVRVKNGQERYYHQVARRFASQLCSTS